MLQYLNKEHMSSEAL